MAEKRIFLIRHGQTESNRRSIYSGRSDEELTPEGIEKVKRTSPAIEELGIERIFTSPVKRAVQTAEIMNRRLCIPMELRDEFMEIKMGPWKGLSEEEVSRSYPRDWRIWNTTPFRLNVRGRETLEQVQTRSLKGIEAIRGMPDIHTSLIVTHVSVIRLLYMFYNAIGRNKYRSIDVSNGTVFRLLFSQSSHRFERLELK